VLTLFCTRTLFRAGRSLIHGPGCPGLLTYPAALETRSGLSYLKQLTAEPDGETDLLAAFLPSFLKMARRYFYSLALRLLAF
jgi:hypothetical protein